MNQLLNQTEKFYLMKIMPPWINYIYADLKLFIDKKNNFNRLKKQFYKQLGYPLNLKEPLSFNEKINWKKLFDRNPLLTLTADKFLVRSYVQEVLGKELSDKILIPIYQVVIKPFQIRFNELPDKYVIKPNHGSGMHLIIQNKDDVNEKNIIKRCKEWLYFNFGLYQYEWAYRNIKRLIIIEKLMESADGTLAKDYKFYCLHGKCHVIRISENRFGRINTSAFLDPEWNMLPVYNPGYSKMENPPQKPMNLKEMISIAQKLSLRFDAVRIDLFNCDGSIYFGEITHYDASGMSRFEPESFDFELGSHWKIRKKYWINYQQAKQTNQTNI